MVYHFILFNPTHHKFDVAGFIERIAIYGVSIFYILSGLTLYLVYKNNKFLKVSNYILFFKKRALRILPLFGIVTFYVFIGKNNFSFESIKIFLLNISGLFSIFSWDKYIVTGGWSIGNELFFYFLFPFMIIFIHKGKFVFGLFLFITFLIYSYFAYFVLKVEFSLSHNWVTYINPFNQLFLFSSGVGMGYISLNKGRNLFYSIGLIISIGIFIFYPANGDFSVIMTENNRIIFTFISIAIVYCTFRIQFIKFKPIDFILKTLGEISYGVYLLHSIVFYNVRKLFIGDIHLDYIILLSIIITIVISYLSYHYFEMKILKMFLSKNSKFS